MDTYRVTRIDGADYVEASAHGDCSRLRIDDDQVVVRCDLTDDVARFSRTAFRRLVEDGQAEVQYAVQGNLGGQVVLTQSELDSLRRHGAAALRQFNGTPPAAAGNSPVRLPA